MGKDYIYLGCIYNPAIRSYEPFELDILAYGENVITVEAISVINENYVKLRDMETKMHLCGVTWLNNTVLINGRPWASAKLATVQLDGTNYVRLRDFDEKLGLCKITYNKSKKMPELSV